MPAVLAILILCIQAPLSSAMDGLGAVDGTNPPCRNLANFDGLPACVICLFNAILDLDPTGCLTLGRLQGAPL